MSCRSNFHTAEDRRDTFLTFGYEQTRSIPGTHECTVPQPDLTFEIHITCDKDTLPQSLVTEALQVHPNGHVNDETFDSLYFGLIMIMKCPQMVKWVSPTIYHYHFKERTSYGNK
jgi:hypothetical protein